MTLFIPLGKRVNDEIEIALPAGNRLACSFTGQGVQSLLFKVVPKLFQGRRFMSSTQRRAQLFRIGGTIQEALFQVSRATYRTGLSRQLIRLGACGKTATPSNPA